MTDEQAPNTGNGNGSASGEANTRAFLLQQLYVKVFLFYATPIHLLYWLFFLSNDRYNHTLFYPT